MNVTDTEEVLILYLEQKINVGGRTVVNIYKLRLHLPQNIIGLLSWIQILSITSLKAFVYCLDSFFPQVS